MIQAIKAVVDEMSGKYEAPDGYPKGRHSWKAFCKTFKADLKDLSDATKGIEIDPRFVVLALEAGYEALEKHPPAFQNGLLALDPYETDEVAKVHYLLQNLAAYVDYATTGEGWTNERDMMIELFDFDPEEDYITNPIYGMSFGLSGMSDDVSDQVNPLTFELKFEEWIKFMTAAHAEMIINSKFLEQLFPALASFGLSEQKIESMVGDDQDRFAARRIAEAVEEGIVDIMVDPTYDKFSTKLRDQVYQVDKHADTLDIPGVCFLIIDESASMRFGLRNARVATMLWHRAELVKQGKIVMAIATYSRHAKMVDICGVAGDYLVDTPEKAQWVQDHFLEKYMKAPGGSTWTRAALEFAIDKAQTIGAEIGTPDMEVILMTDEAKFDPTGLGTGKTTVHVLATSENKPAKQLAEKSGGCFVIIDDIRVGG